jgi:hypothetical protein
MRRTILLTSLAALAIYLAMRNQPEGVLSANIGMSVDDVVAQSTLGMKPIRTMGDNSLMSVEETKTFEFHIAGTTVRFPHCRYYWIETPKNSRHIHVLNVGISPRKMPKPELESFQQEQQQKLRGDGWIPGHYVAKDEETVRMWSGHRTTGDGRYWKKGPTLIIFEVSQMDDTNFVLSLYLRPQDYDASLVFGG